MAAYNKFQDFAEQVLRGVHNFGSNAFKVALTNTAPVATNTVLTDITQISAGNGYTAGGNATTVGISETGGTATVTTTDVVFTATGAVGPFRYAVLYNDTATAPLDALVAWWDYGSPVTLASGDTFTVDFGASLLTLS